MKYFDESGSELTEDDIDLNLGSLSYEQRVTGHVDASTEQPEVAEWVASETVPDAFVKVVQTPYKPAVEAHDIVETVGVYHKYMEEELAEQAKEKAEAEHDRNVQAQMPEAVTMLMSLNSTNIDDSEAMSVPDIFPTWQPDTKYEADEIIRWKNNLYRCLGSFTSSATYPPETDITHYKAIKEPGEDGVFEWVQPTMAEDSYSFGDVVWHNGAKWQSTVPGTHTNTWEPGVYGWTEVDSESVD